MQFINKLTIENLKKYSYIYFIDILIVSCSIFIIFTILITNKSALDVTRDPTQKEYIRPVDKNVDLIFGNPDADLFIVEYGDMECNYCQEIHPILEEFMKNAWGLSGKVSWVWRNGFHINNSSIEKARTLECIRKNNGDQKGWEFLKNAFLTNLPEGRYPFERFVEIMERIDINPDEISQCRQERKLLPGIENGLFDVTELDIEETPRIQFITKEGEKLYDVSGVIQLTQIESIVFNYLNSL